LYADDDFAVLIEMGLVTAAESIFNAILRSVHRR
jgi:hypothetical protein